jgi:hypothetical protein
MVEDDPGEAEEPQEEEQIQAEVVVALAVPDGEGARKFTG